MSMTPAEILAYVDAKLPKPHSLACHCDWCKQERSLHPHERNVRNEV